MKMQLNVNTILEIAKRESRWLYYCVRALIAIYSGIELLRKLAQYFLKIFIRYILKSQYLIDELKGNINFTSITEVEEVEIVGLAAGNITIKGEELQANRLEDMLLLIVEITTTILVIVMVISELIKSSSLFPIL